MEELSKKYIERAKNLIENEGLTGVLDMKMNYIIPGEACLEITLNEKHMNYHRGAHGGTLFSLADTTCGFAVSSLGRSCTTVNSSIEYMRPVIGCDKIICTGKTVKFGKSLAWVECDIKNEKDVLLCKAKFVYFLLESLDQYMND